MAFMCFCEKTFVIVLKYWQCDFDHDIDNIAVEISMYF